jgi:protein TonB
VSLLESNLRYPDKARARGEKGAAQLTLNLNADGRIKMSRIVRSSGSSVLDKEALDLVQRVQPFPKPPTELVGVDLTVPIRFNMR